MRDLLKDTVTIINEGKRIEGVRASVQRDRIFISDVSIPIDVGDTIERTLANGRTEVLHVTNAHQWSGGSLSHYEIEYERQGARAKQPQPSTVNVTVSESVQPHININSTDQSTSILYSQPDELFAEIRSLLRGSVNDVEELNQILLSVDDMENNRRTPHEYMRAYKEFLSVAANHLTILVPMFPSLADLLR